MTTAPHPKPTIPIRRDITVAAVWSTLSKVDVSEHCETKGGFTYLSWSWAWATLKGHYPDATFEKHVFDGQPYMIDSQGFAFVQVTVTVQGQPATEISPVLNHSNKPIKNPDSFAVNTALQRCLVKAIAFHGLGLYVYAGEDLPPGAEPKLGEVVDDEPMVVENIEDTLDLPKKKSSLKKKSTLMISLEACSSAKDLYLWQRDNDGALADLEEHDRALYAELEATYRQLKEKFNG